MLKPIPNFPDYFASDDGSIWSMKQLTGFCKKPDKPRKLKQRLNRGYWSVGLQKNKKLYHKPVHILILETFVSSRPQGMLGCHGINGILDNSVSNLSWQTPKQNMADKYRDGTEQAGEKNPRAILNPLQVRIIRRVYAMGKDGRGTRGDRITEAYLSDIFGVGKTTIGHIIYNRSWKHI